MQLLQDEGWITGLPGVVGSGGDVRLAGAAAKVESHSSESPTARCLQRGPDVSSPGRALEPMEDEDHRGGWIDVGGEVQIHEVSIGRGPSLATETRCLPGAE